MYINVIISVQGTYPDRHNIHYEHCERDVIDMHDMHTANHKDMSSTVGQPNVFIHYPLHLV